MLRIILFSFLFPALLFSQQPVELNVPAAQYLCKNWTAGWITAPGINTKEYNVLFFRKTFELPEKQGSFIVHVSADNHYLLYVNGVLITAGPARSDIRHWRYETIDIGPFLQKGKNAITAQIINWGTYKGWSQFTAHTAFLMQGFSDKEKIVNTSSDWKVLQSHAYRPNPAKPKIDVLDYYGSYACDSVFGNLYPWGWQNISFDDSKWSAAQRFDNAYNHDQSNGYWMLTPRNIPLQEMTKEYLGKIVRTQGIQLTENPFNGKDSIIIAKGQKVTLLFDQQTITIGYPLIDFSGGKGSQIKIKYAECLYYKSKVKANRNDIKDKIMYGFNDVILPDGNKHCQYTPMWLRPFRYIQLEVETKSEPLVIHQFYNRFTTSPVQLKASFACDDDALQNVWKACWQTDKICAQDFLMSDASWEQLQYIGDTRIHALVMMYLSGNDLLVRNALEQFNDSRVPEGLTESNYPNDGLQIIPGYSLIWIEMIHDYMMIRGGKDYIREFNIGIGTVLDWYEKHIDVTGLLAALPYWDFVDWYADRADGVPKGAKEGGSAILTLQYVYALQKAADIYKYTGALEKSLHCQKLSERIKLAVYNQCWSPEKGLIAETPLKNDFTQHTNIMAVLTNTVSQPEYPTIMEKVMTGIGMSKTSIYYDFYFFEALKKAALPDAFFKKVELWKSITALGLTTTPETFTNSRSDCHPWSTHPAYEFLSFTCGIQPAEPGFETVLIAPQPGAMKWLKASFPHVKGDITIDLNHKGEKLSGTIIFPSGLKGKLLWNGQEIQIHEGKQKVSIK